MSFSSTMSGISQGASGLGAVAADIFGAAGASASQAEFQQGEQSAMTNAQIAESEGRIKAAQILRQSTQQIGGERADIAGAGLTQGGSAADLLRSSQSQASLALGLANEQRQINVNGYLQQAASMGAEANAAGVKKKGDVVGGILGAVGAVASIASIF